jgi:SAM-dependent methyltransferase
MGRNFLLSNVWGNEVPAFSKSSRTTHIDIGAGKTPRNTFNADFLIALDLYAESKTNQNTLFIKCDATSVIPIQDNSVDSISSYDFMEHISRWAKDENGEIKFPFINFMNEVHRCLKPGGVFYAITPAFPSGAAFQDPTHVNFISVKTVHYFAGNKPLARELGYGFTGEFQLILQRWISVKNGFPRQSLSQWWISSISDWTKIPLRKAFSIMGPASFSRPFLSEKSHLLWVLQKTIPETL